MFKSRVKQCLLQVTGHWPWRGCSEHGSGINSEWVTCCGEAFKLLAILAALHHVHLNLQPASAADKSPVTSYGSCSHCSTAAMKVHSSQGLDMYTSN